MDTHADLDADYLNPSEEIGRRRRNWRDYLNWVIRRSWILILLGIAGYFIGEDVYSKTPRTYRSWAVIEVLRSEQEEGEMQEQEKIKLSALAEIMSITHKLKMPDIFEGVATSAVFKDRKNVFREQRNLFPWFGDGVAFSESPSPAVLSSRMADWVTISWRENTNLLDIYVDHTDPKIARDVANGLLTQYKLSINREIQRGTEYSLTFIGDTVERANKEILQLDNAILLYKECLEVKAEIRNVELEILKMEKRYLHKWPPLVEAKKLREILMARFQAELDRVMESDEGDKGFWASRSEALGQLKGEQRIQEQLKLVEIHANLLNKDLELKREHYTRLSSKEQEGRATEGYATREFNQAQAPTLPSSPISPKRTQILQTFTLGGLGVGLCVIFLIGFLDPTIRTVSDLESMFNIEIVGTIPQWGTELPTGGKLRRRKTPDVVDPSTGIGEAVRNLRAGLSFLGDRSERTSFLVTSSLPGEGKSWVSANLATSFAQQGDKTLLIDLDLRKPMQHKILGQQDREPGVTNVLSGECEWHAAVRKSEDCELYFIAAGSKTPNPAELFASKELRKLLANAREAFDRVIVDTPPILAVRDAFAPAKLVDSLVLVYHMGKTPAKALDRTLKLLDANQTRPIGLVANRLPKTRRKSAYGYYYSYYGQGDYYGGYREEGED